MRDKTRASDFAISNPFANEGVNGYADVVHTDFSARKARVKIVDAMKTLRTAKRNSLSADDGRVTSLADGVGVSEAGRQLGIGAEGGLSTAAFARLHGARHTLVNTWRNLDAEQPIVDDVCLPSAHHTRPHLRGHSGHGAQVLVCCDAASVDLRRDAFRCEVPSHSTA